MDSFEPLEEQAEKVEYIGQDGERKMLFVEDFLANLEEIRLFQKEQRELRDE